VRLPLFKQRSNRFGCSGLIRIDRLHSEAVHLLSHGGRNKSALLPANFLCFHLVPRLVYASRFQLFNQNPPGQKTIERLAPLAGAPYSHPAGRMINGYARFAKESLLQLVLPTTQSQHFFLERLRFLIRDGKRDHRLEKKVYSEGADDFDQSWANETLETRLLEPGNSDRIEREIITVSVLAGRLFNSEMRLSAVSYHFQKTQERDNGASPN
jgi:hypothetical protein